MEQVRRAWNEGIRAHPSVALASEDFAAFVNERKVALEAGKRQAAGRQVEAGSLATLAPWSFGVPGAQSRKRSSMERLLRQSMA